MYKGAILLNFDLIHQKIIEHQDELTKWHSDLRKQLPIPAYTSVDIRDSGPKLASVDANIYPAGFNNICDIDREAAPEHAKAYLEGVYGPDKKKLLLVTEEHTKNAYYWQNIHSLREVLQNAGYEVQLALPKKMDSIQVETANGQNLEVHGSFGENGKLILDNGFEPEIVLSNNDFSNSLEEWGKSFEMPINPPRETGWHARKKSEHFEHYNKFAAEFASILELPKEHFQIRTEVFETFDMSDQNSKEELAAKVDKMIFELKESYKSLGLDYEPSVFIKNNSGTYGLAVNKVNSGEEVLAWNNRARTKMKAAKGGNKVEEVILQEGIPSRIRSEDAVAEPVIYLFGCQLIGGFLRTHKEKGESESLNSPGAVYKRLCMNDLLIHSEDHPQENVYGWIAKLSSLAIGEEVKSKSDSSHLQVCGKN